jgi:hypothetical protein
VKGCNQGEKGKGIQARGQPMWWIVGDAKGLGGLFVPKPSMHNIFLVLFSIILCKIEPLSLEQDPIYFEFFICEEH